MSPRLLSRVGGILYLVMIAIGIFNEAFVKGRIVVPGDPAATAANLVSNESLWRIGIAGEMIMVFSTVALTFILYLLLRPVNRDLAVLAAIFGTVAITVEAAYSVRLVEALFPLGSAEYLQAFTAEQRGILANLAVRSHSTGFGIVLMLFGPFFLTTGYLISKSGYIPKAIGVLYQIAGLAYLANGFVHILAPTLAGQAFAVIALPAFIGEATFCVWLLVKGVRTQALDAP